ncbi:MAG: hypothetical protein JW869_01765 [Candidatus Omnitrophica bacterium]|nr:hypothetical protein [Candidatus Omnitrophota bacterium]
MRNLIKKKDCDSLGNIFRKAILALFFLLLLAIHVCALADTVSIKDRKMGKYIIRQRMCRRGSILTVQPVAVDLKIFSIINAQSIETIEDYELWLKDSIQYQNDEDGDIWSFPEETLAKESGDCEDFAFLNAAFLHVLGYKPKVMAILGGLMQAGHAICVFEREGKYLWFDNGELKNSGATTIEEFNTHIYKKFACYALYEITLVEQGQNALSNK